MEYKDVMPPFLRSVELVKPTPRGDHRFYWKAKIENECLTIYTGFSDTHDVSHEKCMALTIAKHACHEHNPIQEMWRRAMDMIDGQGFIITNGD